jgi:hypothetical protein
LGLNLYLTSHTMCRTVVDIQYGCYFKPVV